MRDLRGKTALVLGCSAPGGTGWAIAKALGDAGAKVTVAARRLAPLQELSRLIGGFAKTCDAGKPAEIAELVAAAVEKFGKLDIVVNAAGLPVMGPIAEVGAAELQAALDVNYLGNVHLIREAAPVMQDGGAIMVISSSSAQQVVMPFFAYACAKAAADCLVRYAAMELGPRGIRVNSLVPGPIKSDMAAELFAVPGMEAVFAREVPLGRVGKPEDYADAVLWLAGPAFVTGLNIPVSGGNQLTRAPRMDEMPGAGL